jgi:hypothetical protein
MLQFLHNKTANGVGAWMGILTSVFTFIGWLTPEWFGELSWPQLVLVGVGLALTFSLVLAVALAVAGYGFRQFKPASLTELTAPAPDEHISNQVDWAAVIDNKVQGFSDTIRRAVAEDFETMLQPLKDRLTASEVITGPLHQERIKSMQEFIVGWVQSQRLPKPDPIDPNRPINPPPFASIGVGPRMQESKRQNIVRELGLPELQLLPEVKLARENVLKNIKYYNLDEDDKKIWQTGEQKQEWWAHNAEVDAQLKYLKDNNYPCP